MTASLRKRITLGVVGYSAALLLALVFLESYFIHRVAEFYVSTRLEHDSETLITALRATEDNLAYELEERRIHPIYQRPFSGHYFKIQVINQTLRSRSLWDEPFDVPLVQTQYPALFKVQGPQQDELLIHVHQYEIDGVPVTIATAESLALLLPLIRQAQLWSAAAASLLVLIFVFLQYHWMSASLSPLNTLKKQLKELQQGKRLLLSLPDTINEIDPLINELNQLIIALDNRINRSRNAIGNLAHALKTPIAAMQQLCATNSAQSQEFVEKLSHQLETLKDRIDNELKRAQISGAEGGRGQLNVRDEIIDLTNTLQKIYADKNVNVEIHIPAELYATFDRQDFLELTGNLLDNAFKWSSKAVRISAMATNTLEIFFEDDGPGCAAKQLAQLTKRGKRFDESTPGHGLGLSITQDIVAQYRGELHFSSSELGGLSVKVALPV